MAMEFHDVKTFEGQRFDNNKVNLLMELYPSNSITEQSNSITE